MVLRYTDFPVLKPLGFSIAALLENGATSKAVVPQSGKQTTWGMFEHLGETLDVTVGTYLSSTKR